MNIRTLSSVIFLWLVAIGWGQNDTKARLADQVYHKEGGVAFTLDVFQPAKPNGITVVHLVSGGWVSDHRNIDLRIADLATAQGFTMVQVVHGAQPRFKVPEIIKQLQRALRFIKANSQKYGIDPNRLGITGGSAGGHLSLMLAANPLEAKSNSADPLERFSTNVAAVGIFFPPTDFMNFGKADAFSFDNPLLRSGFGKAFFDDEKTVKRERMLELAKELSPILFFTPAMPPTLLIHGDKDMLVPLQQSQVAVEKLKTLGVKTRLDVVSGAGHGWADMNPQFRSILDWFKENIK